MKPHSGSDRMSLPGVGDDGGGGEGDSKPQPCGSNTGAVSAQPHYGFHMCSSVSLLQYIWSPRKGYI